MKKFIVNIFATTGISLILLSVIALLFHGKYICISTIFQVWGMNIMIHLGLIFLSRLEVKHAIIEIALDNVWITIMLIAAGSIFRWSASTPMWILVLMGLAVYIVSGILNLFCMKQEAREINALIKKRNSKDVYGV